jgi:hypothetical protein
MKLKDNQKVYFEKLFEAFKLDSIESYENDNTIYFKVSINIFENFFEYQVL